MRVFFVGLTLLLGLPLMGGPLEILKEGNMRFAKGSFHEREKLIAKQAPFAAILACADSRVAPELIFHQELGDLFVVRVAGNVGTIGVVESLDFASNVLKVPMIVVMGHQNCGAVKAVKTQTGEEELGTIFSMIAPAIKGAKTLKDAVVANVQAQVKYLRGHKLLKERVDAGELQVIGAYYDFQSGLVEFLANPAATLAK